MLKPSQLIQEKAFTFKTLASRDMEQATEFLVRNNERYKSATEEELTKLYALYRCLLIPTLSNHWSYGLVVDGKLSGIFLQIDALDYLNILDTIGDSLILGSCLNISLFESYIRSMPLGIKRGDFVMSLMTVFEPKEDRQTVRRHQKFIYQGFLIFRLGGWRNSLFVTQNPIPFLRINAEVVAESSQEETLGKQYLMRLKLSKMALLSSPFQNIQPRL